MTISGKKHSCFKINLVELYKNIYNFNVIFILFKMGEITDLKGDIQLNKSRIQIVNMLENQVKQLRETYDGKNIKNLFDETNKLVKESISSNNVIDKLLVFFNKFFNISSSKFYYLIYL